VIDASVVGPVHYITPNLVVVHSCNGAAFDYNVRVHILSALNYIACNLLNSG